MISAIAMDMNLVLHYPFAVAIIGGFYNKISPFLTTIFMFLLRLIFNMFRFCIYVNVEMGGISPFIINLNI